MNKYTYKITLLSDAGSWINVYLPGLISEWTALGHGVTWLHTTDDYPEQGDFAFFLSYSRLLPEAMLARHRHNLVVHESALPLGKGWSPLTWQILEGRNDIPVTLFEATADVDSGPIYLQDTMQFEGHELVDELRQKQAEATLTLCKAFVDQYPAILKEARPQTGEASYYARRRPSDSRLDLDKSIQEQFNLLRVVDNDKYPAWFEYLGQRYVLKVEKIPTSTS